MKTKKPLLSRKAKTLIYTSIVLFALTIIITSNFPITPWNSFRLAEKARLLGSARILGTESVVSAGQDAVIIAESEEFCMTYGYKFFGTNDTGNLVHKKKTGDLTFLSIETQSSYSGWEDEYFTIILFDEYPQAVRATLTLQPYVEYSSNGTKKLYERSFTVDATRRTEKYFIFRMNTEYDFETWHENTSLIYWLRMSLNHNSAVTNPVPGKIQLYDKDDNLILEREIDLQNPSKQ